MSKKHALVLMWDGKTIDEHTIAQIATVLMHNRITVPELLTSVYKDAEGIADSLIKEAAIVKVEAEDNAAEALKVAIVYIGKRFEVALTNTNGDLSTFAAELSNACTVDRVEMRWNGGEKSELLKAVDIISEADAIIPPSLARKYHFSSRVVAIIKQIHAYVPR